MNAEVFKKENILFDETSTTQTEAFMEIAKFAQERGYVTSVDEYFEGLKQREAEATTGFKDGIAIPHCKNATVIKPGMFLVKFKHAIEWNTLDGQPVKVAFGLTIPLEGAQEHLKLLSLIARKMIDDDFRNGVLNESNPDKLTEIIDEIAF